ncbi:MAG: DUF2817 domain-containing protein [Bdellovibrionales bacterium]|nr:DUF2817 domain-containing protein [Bdellovibrionales bacterium]
MSFPELLFLESLLKNGDCRSSVIAEVEDAGGKLPIYSVELGSRDPRAPVLALVGGVHGQEKIGSQVVLSYLETWLELLRWDSVAHHLLEKSRLLFLPILNPVGMKHLRRGNGNRVDLMRNSPVDADAHSLPLVGGHRITRYLPWYRGPENGPREPETEALAAWVRREILPAPFSLVLDCHSGYGSVDRLWFPWSHTLQPWPLVPEAFALKNLLDNTYPNHVYRMEPNSHGYTISGDLWDWLWKEQRHVFFPLTLEMGSWNWIRKNPIQLIDSLGLFHPIHLHRHKRILRRHITLLDFLHRAVISHGSWARPIPGEREGLREDAMNHWFHDL